MRSNKSSAPVRNNPCRKSKCDQSREMRQYNLIVPQRTNDGFTRNGFVQLPQLAQGLCGRFGGLGVAQKRPTCQDAQGSALLRLLGSPTSFPERSKPNATIFKTAKGSQSTTCKPYNACKTKQKGRETSRCHVQKRDITAKPPALEAYPLLACTLSPHDPRRAERHASRHRRTELGSCHGHWTRGLRWPHWRGDGHNSTHQVRSSEHARSRREWR